MCIRLVRRYESCRRQDGSKVQHTRQHIIRCSMPYDFYGTNSFDYHPCLQTLDALEEWYQQECPECSGDSNHPRVNRFKKVWHFANKNNSAAVEWYAISLLRIISVALDADPGMGHRLADLDGLLLTAFLENVTDYILPEMVCREVPQHGYSNPNLQHSDSDQPCPCITEMYDAYQNPAVFLRRIMLNRLVEIASEAFDGDATVNDRFNTRVADLAAARMISCKKMQPLRVMDNGELVLPLTHIYPYTRDSLESRIRVLEQDMTKFIGDVAMKVGIYRWYNEQRFQNYTDVLDVAKIILAADRGISLNFARCVWAKILWILPPRNRQYPLMTFDGPVGLENTATVWARKIHHKVMVWESGATPLEKEIGLFGDFLEGDTPNRLIFLDHERESWLIGTLRESGRIIMAYKHMDTLTAEVKAKFQGTACDVCGNDFFAAPVDEAGTPSDNHGWDDPVVHRACARKPDGTPFHVVGKRCYIRIARDVDQRLIPHCPFCRQSYRTPSPDHVIAPGQDSGDFIDG